MADTFVDIYLPTYRLGPDEDERFYPSQARALADEVLKAEITDDKEWDESYDSMNDLSTTISDKVREAVTTKLNLPRYKIIVQTTIGQNHDQVSHICVPSTACTTPSCPFCTVLSKNQAGLACFCFDIFLCMSFFDVSKPSPC